MNKITSYLLVLSVLISGLINLTGCQKADSIKETTSMASSNENVTIYDEDKQNISHFLDQYGIVILPEFDSVSDLDIGVAIACSTIMDWGKSDGLFLKDGIDVFGVSNSSRQFDVSSELCEKLLNKYYNEGSGAFKNSDLGDSSEYCLKWVEDKLKLDDDNQLVLDNIEELNRKGLEKEGHLKVENIELKDDKYVVETSLILNGLVIEKREYIVGRHEDGNFYLISMKILEKYIEK